MKSYEGGKLLMKNKTGLIQNLFSVNQQYFYWIDTDWPN